MAGTWPVRTRRSRTGSRRTPNPRLDLPAGPANVSHQRFLVGKQKFDRVRAANAAVAGKLSTSLDDARLAAVRELPWIVSVLVFVAVLGAVAALFARRVAGRITEPLVDMQETVDRLAAGDTEARTRSPAPGRSAGWGRR